MRMSMSDASASGAEGTGLRVEAIMADGPSCHPADLPLLLPEGKLFGGHFGDPLFLEQFN